MTADNFIIKIEELGIDFGSSATTVVGVDKEKNIVLFEPLFSIMARENNSENYIFFEKAFDKDIIKNCVVYDDIKEAILLQKEIAERYLEEVFTYVKNTKIPALLRNHDNENARYDFSELKTVCYGYPQYSVNCFAEQYCKVMNEILPNVLKKVFEKDNISVLSNCEPQLAALAYFSATLDREKNGSVFKKDDLMLVLDFGGHTFDMALLKVKGNNTLEGIKSQSLQMPEVMGSGKKINSLIVKKVSKDKNDRGVEEAKIDLFENAITNKTRKTHLLQFPRFEDGSSNGSEISLAYNVEQSQISITEIYRNGECFDRGTINLTGLYLGICQCVKAFLDELNLEKRSIKHVLFTGGTSRILYLRKEVEAIIKELLTSDHYIYQIDTYNDRNEKCKDNELTIFYKAPNFLYNHRVYRAPKKDETLSSENVVALGAALYALDPELLEAGDDSGGNRPIDTPPPPSNLSEIEVLVKRLYYDYKSCIKDNYKNGFCDACKDLLDLIDLSKP